MVIKLHHMASGIDSKWGLIPVSAKYDNVATRNAKIAFQVHKLALIGEF